MLLPPGSDEEPRWWTTPESWQQAEVLRARLVEQGVTLTIDSDESEMPDEPAPAHVLDPDHYVELTGRVDEDRITVSVLDTGASVEVDGFSSDAAPVVAVVRTILAAIGELFGWQPEPGAQEDLAGWEK